MWEGAPAGASFDLPCLTQRDCSRADLGGEADPAIARVARFAPIAPGKELCVRSPIGGDRCRGSTDTASVESLSMA
jgi:hypothetical protein